MFNLKVADLSYRELCSELKHGLYIQMGAFVLDIQTQIPAAIHGFATIYADYSLASREFADFHVRLKSSQGVRRWIRKQVLFECDGALPFKPLPYTQAFPMLEWGMNWCVSSHAHGYLMIHAAVLERDGRAVILPAPPGSGKSTLCAALTHHGWRLLSDELTLINVKDGLITPLPRPVSLKNDSIGVIENFVPDAVFSIPVTDTIKGTVAHLKPPPDSVMRGHELARAAWIVFPQFKADSETMIEAIPKARAFIRVADNAFNYSLLGSAGFHALAKVLDNADAFELSYSALDQAMQFFDSLAKAEE
ncbi:HprK-related kinase A [Undibacterium sp. Jales W-56]|uniref:HprK-related kinase A n=1 Tax=Undibacterium sp. Jales W-56 TaxID=2897325 RepID=UPI0021D0F13A|nr:HprK-related kinase A [Undibacterium sp. Jales W-56]MCU6434148.1 HprK-related kinase A [Undibacterium sp. Jales W-56]